jgi:hypothetical protein
MYKDASHSSVTAFINNAENPQRKKDAKEILKIIKEITGKKPGLWGTSIIGFDLYHYTYEIGFSPRKTALSIYIMPGYDDYSSLLKKLGPHTKGRSCLYIKKLEDIDMDILKKNHEAGLYNNAEKIL